VVAEKCTHGPVEDSKRCTEPVGFEKCTHGPVEDSKRCTEPVGFEKCTHVSVPGSKSANEYIRLLGTRSPVSLNKLRI
jgi:hypothetical protein